MTCTWPEGSCQCAMQEATKPDYAGRVWMHCETGLTMTKASMSRFMMFCLRNSVEFGSVDAFAPEHSGCTVLASIRLRPDQFEDFERETGGKLRKPPVITLNSGDI